MIRRSSRRGESDGEVKCGFDHAVALALVHAMSLLLRCHPALAGVEYAPEMRPMDELLAGASSSEIDRSEMKEVSLLPETDAMPAQTDAAGPGPVTDAASDSTLSPSPTSPLVKALFSVQFPLALEFVAATGASGQEEIFLRLHEGDVFTRSFSLSQDLAARAAQGALTKEESDTIELELTLLQGTLFKLPRNEQDLKSALGFAIETAIVPDDLPDLITVHVQLGLGASMQASSYLVEVLSGFISNHN
jgi:hypothetical protein